MALDFLRDLLTHDAEDLARARGLAHIGRNDAAAPVGDPSRAHYLEP